MNLTFTEEEEAFRRADGPWLIRGIYDTDMPLRGFMREHPLNALPGADYAWEAVCRAQSR